MANKLPALHFYPGDWKKDPGIQSLDYEERGIWFEILLLMWESKTRGKLMLNGKKMKDEMIAGLLKIPVKKYQSVMKKLIDRGVARVTKNAGVIFNKRMVSDEKRRQLAVIRGQRGGNPNFKKGCKNLYYKGKEAIPKDNLKDNPFIEDEDEDEKEVKSFDFNSMWKKYPSRIGKKAAERHFRASVKTEQDFKDIQKALGTYIAFVRDDGRSWQNGSTWFNNWREDWLNFVPPPEPGAEQEEAPDEGADENLDPRWQSIIAEIKKQVLPEAFKTYFAPIKFVDAVGDEILLEVPDGYFKNYIENASRDLILGVASEKLGRTISKQTILIQADTLIPTEAK